MGRLAQLGSIRSDWIGAEYANGRTNLSVIDTLTESAASRENRLIIGELQTRCASTESENGLLRAANDSLEAKVGSLQAENVSLREYLDRVLVTLAKASGATPVTKTAQAPEVVKPESLARVGGSDRLAEDGEDQIDRSLRPAIRADRPPSVPPRDAATPPVSLQIAYMERRTSRAESTLDDLVWMISRLEEAR